MFLSNSLTFSVPDEGYVRNGSSTPIQVLFSDLFSNISIESKNNNKKKREKSMKYRKK